MPLRFSILCFEIDISGSYFHSLRMTMYTAFILVPTHCSG